MYSRETQSPGSHYSGETQARSLAPTIDVSLASPSFDYASLNAPLWPHRLSSSFSAMADQIAAASQALALVPSTAFSGNDLAAEFAVLKSKLASIESTQERLAAEFTALKEQFTELNTDKGPAFEELDKKIEALKKILFCLSQSTATSCAFEQLSMYGFEDGTQGTRGKRWQATAELPLY